jgi:hypothetical protein
MALAALRYPDSFDPAAAAQWAVDNAATYQPVAGGDPCTEFVSNALMAAGMTTDSNWYPETDAVDRYVNSAHLSKQWFGAKALKDRLFVNGWVSMRPLRPNDIDSTYNVGLGDIIYYEWVGIDGVDRVHMAMVTTAYQYPLVTDENGNNRFAINRPWDWSKVEEKPLLEVYPNMQAYLLHWE